MAGRANAAGQQSRILKGVLALRVPELRRKQAGRHPKISVILAAVTNSQAIKVTKWSTFAGDLDVSEQQPDRISDNLGDVVGAGPIAPNSPDATPAEPAQDPAKQSMSVESPKIAPEQGEADKAKDTPKAEVTKPEVTKPEAAKAEAPRVEAKAEAPKSPGQILIMPRDQAWNGDSGDSKTQPAGGGIFGRRRVAALAAVIALAAVAGAIGGALATAGFGRVAGDSTKVASSRALEDTISRLDTEVAALRTSLEQASKHSASQISKTSDRLDKVEKAQAEPAAKLAKLSETVEKLRTASVAAPAVAPVAAAAATPVAPKESTGSIQTANAAPAQVPLPAPKPEVARLPTVEGWVLRDAGNGSALIESRQGIFEVYAGDPIPGLGRVDAIRKQDGRWVVVTSRGLIVGR
jgi:outer membrane biosynthesis protein TonB